MTATSDARLRFVVCEDGAEYLERFRRFLGESFDFLPAHDFEEARAAFEAAAGLAGNRREQELLKRRAAEAAAKALS